MPTTDEMREWYVRRDRTGRSGRKEYELEFDRWLAQHDREVRAQALEDAADAFYMARINVAIFGDSPEAHWWGGANSARDRLVESLRARAEKERG